MVVGAFPAAKLGVLAFKQLSKPIANVIKNKAKQSPFFRQYVCMPPAQFYNWVEIQTKMWALNLGKPANIPQLNENMAIELGANLLGEVIIFTIGAGLLIFEYIRQSNKEAKKDELIIQEKLELNNTISDLALRLEQQDAQLREMNRIIADLDSRRWLPKSFKLSSGKNESTNEPPPPSSATPLSSSNGLSSSQIVKNQTTSQAFVSGNYDPNYGLIFKALNFIENEVFYSDATTTIDRQTGIIQRALIQLNCAS